MLGSRKKQKKQRIAGIEQDELLDPIELADPDSSFCEFKGVQIHYKVCHGKEEEEEAVTKVTSENQAPSEDLVGNQPKKHNGFPMILLHGFGASVFSWDRVLKPLALTIGSKVVAFDRPAFGLTSRLFVTPTTTNSGLVPIGSEKKDEDARPLNPYSMAFSVLATLYYINLLAADKIILLGYVFSHFKT